MRSRRPRALPGGVIAVGSGDATRAGIAPKAALLDQAARADLPVPRSWIVRDGTPAAAARALPIDRPVAVRSAFGAEDLATASMAGWFDSFLDVAPADVEGRIEAVLASAGRHHGAFRRDVLVMDMVRATHAGVAFTEPDHLVDIVNVADGLADGLVRGDEPGRRIELHRFDDATAIGPWAERLRTLLTGVRRVLGPGPRRRGWDVEWADDGATCHLIQVRPVTAPLPRVETLTIANHRELLPSLPSTFMTSLIASCADDLYGWWRRRSADLPGSRPFVIVRGGRPFINLSLLEDTLEIIGLPTRLVAEGFGGRPARDRPGRPARVIRHARVIAGLGIGQLGALLGHRRHCASAARIGARPAPDWRQAVGDAQRAYVGMVTGMMPLSSAAAMGTALLSRTGTLQHHAGRHRTVTTEMALALTGGERSAFLERFGHRGIYESDLARPRYAEDPPQLAPGRPAAHPARATQRRRLAVLLTAPVWWMARRPIAAREEFRDAAMHGFANVRRSILRLADRAVVNGQLPSTDAVWLLTVDEVMGLDDGAAFDALFLDGRRQERARLEAIPVPDLVRSDVDPDDWVRPIRPPTGHPAEVRGIGLGPGRVSGPAWIMQEPSCDVPPGHVVVAPAVDAGWMQVFHLATAVVVETGGDLSHGSILLRELGIPSVTNVGPMAGRVRTGDLLHVDAGRGRVTVEAAP